MAYMVRCRYCNHYFFGVSLRHLEDAMIDHMSDKHSDCAVVFGVVTISARDFQDYLKSKDNQRFWEALRVSRKPSKISLFV